MMHPETVAIVQEQQRFQGHIPSTPDASRAADTTDKRSFSLWRLLRETLSATPHRKVRSASYSPPGTEERLPRSSKRRAKSCGHAADAHDHRTQHHCRRHHRDGSGCAATGTADAWRKSKMLQELEASTAGGCSSAIPTAAVLRRCVRTTVRDPRDPSEQPAAWSNGWSRLAAQQRPCRNCRQLFFARNVDARAGAAFCSLDCKSSFEYRECVQFIVDERVDGEALDTPTRAA